MISELTPYKMKDAVRIVTGKTPSTSRPDYFGDLFPFITPSDIPTYNERLIEETERGLTEAGYSLLKNFLLPINTVCYVAIGSTVGKMCMTHRPSFANQQLHGLIAKPKITDPHFLFYYLKLLTPYIKAIAEGRGAGKAIINKSEFSRIDLQLPPLPAQQRIASILSAYDDLIENNNKRIALLEQMAEQIYKEWFVRMRFPGYENAEFEKGVPKGWLVELNDYINVVKGKSYIGEEINEVGEGKPFVNLKSFNRGGGYRYDGIKFYTGKYHQKQIVKEGDIVMAVTDMTQDRAVVGRVARIPKTEYPEMVISLDAAKIVLKKNIPKSFFYATLRFGFFGNTIKEFANGSNVLHLKPELAYKMKSIIPTDESLMIRMDKIIEPYFNQIDNCFLQNQILKQTRDLLLPRLISGKLRVKEIKEAPLSKAEV